MKRRYFIKGAGIASAVIPFAGCSFRSQQVTTRYKPSGSVPRRILGKTGIEVSMLGFGSHLKKELIARPEYRDRMIKLGYEGGITTFDIYNHSGYGQFKPMGDSLRGIRKNVVISLVVTDSTDKIQEEIDGALRDLRTDYIDLYRHYIVDDDRMKKLEQNKKAGKIRAIGVVSHDVATMNGYIDRYQDILDYVMIIYNFHHNCGFSSENYPENDYSALIPRCRTLGLGILGIKPMGSDAMIALAHKSGFFTNKKVHIAQAMLRHIYESGAIHSALPAMNSIEEVITNLESAYDPRLTADGRRLLQDLSAVAASTKRAYLPGHYQWLENWAQKVG